MGVATAVPISDATLWHASSSRPEEDGCVGASRSKAKEVVLPPKVPAPEESSVPSQYPVSSRLGSLRLSGYRVSWCQSEKKRPPVAVRSRGSLAALPARWLHAAREQRPSEPRLKKFHFCAVCAVFEGRKDCRSCSAYYKSSKELISLLIPHTKHGYPLEKIP